MPIGNHNHDAASAHIRINLGEHQMMLTKKAVERAGGTCGCTDTRRCADPNCGPAKVERTDWNTPLVCHRQGLCVCGGVKLECYHTDYVPLTPTEALWRFADRHSAPAPAAPKIQTKEQVRADTVEVEREEREKAQIAARRFQETVMERPAHYTIFAIEPQTFCMINDLPAWASHAIKYIVRAPHKNEDETIDIRKAIRICEMRLEELKRRKDGTIGDIVGRPL